MATYRIIFSDTPNPTTMFIEAQTIKQEGPSCIFLDANNNVVSVFPIEDVSSIVPEAKSEQD